MFGIKSLSKKTNSALSLKYDTEYKVREENTGYNLINFEKIFLNRDLNIVTLHKESREKYYIQKIVN